MIAPDSARVKTAGKFFRLGGEKFFIRGITYGPFAPVADGAQLPSGDQLKRDLEKIQAFGINVLRVYHVPSEEFLFACEERALKLLVTIPWAQHIDFMARPSRRETALRTVREGVRSCRGSATVMGFFVANEVEATLVRWMGPAPVGAFLEELFQAGREEDPNALFAYPNYPSTEYLHPGNGDFIAFNVYLEEEESFRRYLRRLQNLAGDKPLIISEFGMDSGTHGEARQAEVVDWFWRGVAEGGLAGGMWFSFTDEWFTGSRDIRDWHFGLVNQAREEKPSCDVTRRWLEPGGGIDRLPEFEDAPSVSVIVCTYNGTRTLRACLDSLRNLRYPDYEILVIDDGSESAIEEICRDVSAVRYFRQEHSGLSAARNRGAQEARGEVLVYTDDDCVADEDWLTHLTRTMREGGYPAMGGPNVPPPAENLAQACVAAAPGGPSHVLLTDREAEHIPGCNFAIRRDAFEEVDGFIPEFTTAGDDVDICWRLQEMGCELDSLPPPWFGIFGALGSQITSGSSVVMEKRKLC